MPPTGAEAKVKDPEYCNWLKVGLALYYLKVGLSSFIQDEVDAMHQLILQTLYGDSPVPASQCSSCNAKDVKRIGSSNTWKFRSTCPQRLCNTWLKELLAWHANSTSSKIYWENCEVTAWPHASWECAKLYMPRGQLPTNTGPAQSDSQALLTLMANCKYFHNKLSQGGLYRIHMVSTLRNRVMHSEDMRLSDKDRKHFLQDIIQLLEDPFHLKSLEECKQAVVEIHKINNDSLDVFFNVDLEIRALSECVNDCRQELGVYKVSTEKTVDSLKVAEKTVDSLKEELKDLKDQLSKFEETRYKVECIDTQCQNIDTRVTKLSKKVTLGLKHMKGHVRKQHARCSVMKKFFDMHKRKAVTDQSQQSKELRKLNVEIELIKGNTSQAPATTADVRDIQWSLIKAYECVQIISVNPVFDTAVYWKDLKDFYTDVVIEKDKEDCVQWRKDEQQLNKEKVKSFRQIFEKGDKKVTRIILKAPAGHGKSTFCRKLVHTWCSVQKKQLNILSDDGMPNKFETSGLKDEDEMLRFDVLLYVCLRDISEEKTLMDVVYTQFPLHESQGLSHRSHIESLIGKAENNKVLLIMDGLDEMDNSFSFIEKIMQRRLYPHLTVLATTRPWKIGQLNLIRSAHIDLLLDLQGFSYENSMLFAKRIFDKYYRDETALTQFQQDIQTNSVIRSLICVPLLLLFIIHVWYEKKSFPQTIHELYLEMLNVMVNRYLEGKERIENNKGRQDDKKYILPKSWPLETMTFTVTSKLKSLSLHQNFGEGFLASVCEVANHFLVADIEETSLVFEEKGLVELLGKDGTAKLQTALDLGILSNSESPGIFRKKICLTFLHKTVQEFLAAINICCREDRCNLFVDSLNTLDNVFQNELIITFVAGISTIHCQKIFEKIYEVCDKDRAVITREYIMPDLSRLYRDCIREACGEAVNLKLYCMYAYLQDYMNIVYSASNVRTLLRRVDLYSCIFNDVTLDLSESNYLEYICLVDVTMKGKLLISKCTQLEYLKLKKCRLGDAVMDLSESNCLEYISLNGVTMKGKLLLSKCTQLKYLKLKKCSLDDATLDLLESNFLEDLSLEDVTMNDKLSQSHCSQLKCLKPEECSLDDATLNWSELNCQNSTHLVYLELPRCSLNVDTLNLTDIKSQKYLSSLKDVILKCKPLLSQCTKLKSLKLQKCNLDDVTLDLSESSCLEYLSLEDVAMMGKLLLSKCTQLKHLKLQKCNLDDATLDLLESNCLKHICLEDVTMMGKLLLSKCSHLRCLKLQKCNLDDGTLDLLESNCLKHICLEDVTMMGKLLLSKCSHLRCLKLQKCNLDDGTLDLLESNCLKHICLEDVTMNGKILISECTQLKCLNLYKCILDDASLDLSESKCLEDFSLVHVTMKGKLLLSKCTHLKHLKLQKCILDDALLDLSGSINLEWFLCNKVTMTGKSRLVLSNCTQLKWLKLTYCILVDAILDLSESACLEWFLYNKMALKSRNRLSKCTNLKEMMLVICRLGEFTLDLSGSTCLIKEIFHDESQCKQIQCLTKKNADLGDALLSLDSVNHLIEFTLTISKEVEMFHNRMFQCKQLYHLSMKNVNLCDALLSVDSVDYLDDLTLDNVTMNKECTDVLCKSLSQCKQLHKLSIKNVDLCDALLSLDSVNDFFELNLDNVTMGQYCKEMLFKSLCKSKCLTVLSVMNFELDDALLGFHRLHKLELDNVKINIDSKILLFVIMSHCEWLKNLSLKNLDLSEGKHELYNMNRLTNITIDNVKMGSVSKVLMCKSLSQCTQLCALSLKTLDLGDGLLSLNNMEILCSLTINNVTMCKDGYLMLCDGISTCKTLMYLSMKDLDLGDGLLSLNSLEILHSLTIDNVTMCKDGYVMLCNSMSMCTQLCTLSLKNLDLDNGLLMLNNLHILDSVTMDNVTMCKDGYFILCNSLSTCTQLKLLQLLNLDLGFANPCLDNLHGLELVNITIPLECVDYIKLSVQHWTHLHFYPFAHTRELIIENTADICKKCIVNYTKKKVVDDDDDDDDDDDVSFDYCYCLFSDDDDDDDDDIYGDDKHNC